MDLVLIGKTGAGKTYTAQRLSQSGKFKQVPTLTTRERRPGEDDSEYYFVDDDTFSDCIGNGSTVDYSDFYLANGRKVCYATSRNIWDSFRDAPNRVIILDPIRLNHTWLNDEELSQALRVYLDINEDTRRKRLKARGDDPREIEHRLALERVQNTPNSETYFYDRARGYADIVIKSVKAQNKLIKAFTGGTEND